MRPAAWGRSVAYWIREFLGENEYPRYVAEWHARHAAPADPSGRAAGHRPLTAGEFFRERVRTRYEGGVNRCC